MVVVGTGGAGTKIMREDYPYEEGLTAGTTRLKTNDFSLVAENDIRHNKEEPGID